MRRGKQSATNPLLPAKLQRSFLWTLVQRTAHSHQLPQEVLTCESFAVQHTWGQGHPSVCVRQLTVSEEFQIDYLLSAGALKGRSIMLKPKEELKKQNKTKKTTKKTSLLLPIYRGENSTLSFYGSRVEVRLQTPAHHDLRSRQDLQKEISNWCNCSQNHISHCPNKTIHIFLNAEVSCFVDLSLWCFILMFKIAPLKNI